MKVAILAILWVMFLLTTYPMLNGTFLTMPFTTNIHYSGLKSKQKLQTHENFGTTRTGVSLCSQDSEGTDGNNIDSQELLPQTLSMNNKDKH